MTPTPSMDEAIARLFAEGYSHQVVLERGLAAGRWRAPDIDRVLRMHQWRLDATGRVPRSQRPVVTPGKPLSLVGSGLAESARDAAADRLASGAVRPLRSVGALPQPRPESHPAVEGHRVKAPPGREDERGWTCTCGAPWLGNGCAKGGGRRKVSLDEAAAVMAADGRSGLSVSAHVAIVPARSAPAPTVPAPEPGIELASAGATWLLAAGKAHKAAAVKARARRAAAAVEALRTELLARAEADEAEAQAAAEIEALTAKLRRIDAERARLAADIVAKGGKVGSGKRPRARAES